MKIEIQAEGWFFLCSLVPINRDCFFCFKTKEG